MWDNSYLWKTGHLSVYLIKGEGIIKSILILLNKSNIYLGPGTYVEQQNSTFFFSTLKDTRFKSSIFSLILRADHPTFCFLFLSCKSFPIIFPFLSCESKPFPYSIRPSNYSSISSDNFSSYVTEETGHQTWNPWILSCWTKKFTQMCIHPSNIPSEDHVSSPSGSNQILYQCSWFHPLPSLERTWTINFLLYFLCSERFSKYIAAIPTTSYEGRQSMVFAKGQPCFIPCKFLCWLEHVSTYLKGQPTYRLARELRHDLEDEQVLSPS